MKPAKFENIIIYEDDNLIIVNKPPGLSTLEDRSNPSNILKIARSYLSDITVCHRLDKETSGILVLAKKPEDYAAFSKLLENRKVSKTYLAIVDGKCETEHFECDKPLFTSGRGIAKVNYSKGKDSITQFKRLFVGKKHSILECKPVTGRYHQIRGHLSYTNLPITGDHIYGGKPFYLSEIKRNYNFSSYEEELPVIKRLALHARSIGFTLNEKEYYLEADLPKDFKVAEKLIRKHV